MQPHEEAPRPGGSGGQETAGEHVTTTVQQPDATVTRRGGDPVITRRRNARAVDDFLDQMGFRLTPADVLSLTVPPPLPDVAACGGPHAGPCDHWRTCTGMSLTVAERDAAGAQHPWRLVA
ncbi:hypothetical protein AB0873_09570 [Micromonospora sp. NPDC047707]|uniref:hypothetical protein n=1 Tax=Micromonospora sp. NPDC047707 TaxID=3154498 RepID=UPI0034560088